MSTGGGHSQLEEVMSVVGVPVMTKASFISTERDIGMIWQKELTEAMAEAGREEKRLAVERDQYHEDVPAITIIVDGDWSKRSHRHSYNANSGVAIIIRQVTGKLLYLGVKNKHCHACATNIPPDQHTCFRNWTKSSSEMETDIILEGFLEAERVHGVRYIEFIGDGDSSVYPTLLQNVPGWGYAIKKLECANHACKCYRGALEKLVQDNPSYKGSGGLTQKMRKRLVSAARAAIRMRSKEEDKKAALASLKADLQNGPRHCFGIHDQCSTDFCKTARDQQVPSSSSESLGSHSVCHFCKTARDQQVPSSSSESLGSHSVCPSSSSFTVCTMSSSTACSTTPFNTCPSTSSALYTAHSSSSLSTVCPTTSSSSSPSTASHFSPVHDDLTPSHSLSAHDDPTASHSSSAHVASHSSAYDDLNDPNIPTASQFDDTNNPTASQFLSDPDDTDPTASQFSSDPDVTTDDLIGALIPCNKTIAYKLHALQ